MQDITPTSALFVAVNAALGALIAILTQALPAFKALPVPTFAWLVIALFLADLAFGALRGVHPSQNLTMPVRLVALIASYGANVLVAAMLAH